MDVCSNKVSDGNSSNMMIFNSSSANFVVELECLSVDSNVEQRELGMYTGGHGLYVDKLVM